MLTCPICKSTTKKTLYTKRDSLAIELLECCNEPENIEFLNKISICFSECSVCGLKFLDNRLTTNSLGRMYQLWYNNGYRILTNSPSYIKNRIREFQKYFYPQIKNYIKNGFKLLDIGCGSGIFLKVCTDKGLRCVGVEFDSSAAELAQNYTGCNIFVGEFQQLDIKDKFNIISMLDFIEHSTSPLDDLIHARNFLAEDGIIFLRTPNVDSLQSKYMKKDWYGIISLHLFYFNKKTITKLLNKAGFDIISIKCHNYISLISFISDRTRYILRKLIAKKNEVGNKDNDDGLLVSTNSQHPRVNIYLRGLLMEFLDIIGGYMDMGNNMTVIARKRND